MKFRTFCLKKITFRDNFFKKDEIRDHFIQKNDNTDLIHSFSTNRTFPVIRKKSGQIHAKRVYFIQF